MSKVKYYYDPDTLSYRKIEKSRSRRRLNLFLFLLWSILLTSTGVFMGYMHKVPILEKDIPVSKNKLEKISSVFIELDKTLEKTQIQIKQNMDFLDAQNYSIKYNKKTAEDELSKIQFKKVKLNTALARFKLQHLKLDSISREMKKANSIEMDKLKAKERILKPNGLLIQILISLSTFLLGFLLNYFINRNQREKIELSAKKAVGFDKNKYENIISSLKTKNKEQVKALRTGLLLRITELQDEVNINSDKYKTCALNLEHETKQNSQLRTRIKELKAELDQYK